MLWITNDNVVMAFMNIILGMVLLQVFTHNYRTEGNLANHAGK